MAPAADDPGDHTRLRCTARGGLCRLDRAGPRHALVGAEELHIAFVPDRFAARGKFLFCMRAADGKEHWNTGEYHDVVSPARIVSTMYFSDPAGNIVPPTEAGLPADCPSEFFDIVTFAPLVGGRTQLTLHRRNRPSINDQFKGMMNAGWNQSLDRFGRIATLRLGFRPLSKQYIVNEAACAVAGIAASK